MGRHLDFDAARAENLGEPITFTLGGMDWTTLPELPAAPLLDLAAAADLDEIDPKAVKALADFVRSVVIREQRDAFEAMLREQEIGFRTILLVVQGLIEESTGRPLDTPPSSPLAPSSDGQSSNHIYVDPEATLSL